MAQINQRHSSRDNPEFKGFYDAYKVVELQQAKEYWCDQYQITYLEGKQREKELLAKIDELEREIASKNTMLERCFNQCKKLKAMLSRGME